METKQKFSIPLQNEVVRNQISQTLHEFSVLQLHVFRPKNDEWTEVFILMAGPKEAETLRSRKWIGKAAAIDKVNVHVSYEQKAEFHLKCGNPFYQYYAAPSAIVWMKEDLTEPLKIHPTKKAFKKKLNIFKEKFYHDHDILMTEAHKFLSRRMYSSVFQNYLTIFEHHLGYLENLYTGWNFFDKDLHVRLKQLIRYIPEIQKVFVMKNQENFYLISKMEESVSVAEDGGESNIYSELYGAVKSAEAQLYKMVADRFSKFSSIIRFKKSPQVISHPAKDSESKNPLFENILKTVITKLAPEEIYLFHKREIFSPNPEEMQGIYYLLVIGDGIGNSAIQDIQQSVSDMSNGRTTVIILGHSRIFIQQNLSKHQQMMQRMITDENKVYQSNDFHPPIHWQDSVWDSDWKFDMHYRTLKYFVAQYFNLRDNLQNDNHYGLVQLFSNSIIRLLRIYIYAALPFYRPHYLNTYSTWKLCVYADPSLEKTEFLFEKLSTDFYKLIDYYIKYSDNSGMSSMEELIMMDEILNLLMEKLEQLIKDQNLNAQTD